MEEVKITSGFAQILDGKCLHCGDGVPHYCEKCHQDLIGENARLQYHLSKTIPTEENEFRLQNIVYHFEKIKHIQPILEITENDVKAIKELMAVKEHLKHKYETYYKLYWEDSVPVSVIQNKHKEVVDRLNYLNCKNGYTTKEEHEEIEELCNELAFLEELLDGKEKYKDE